MIDAISPREYAQENIYQLPDSDSVTLGGEYKNNNISKVQTQLIEGERITLSLPYSTSGNNKTEWKCRIYRTDKGFNLVNTKSNYSEAVNFGPLTKKKTLTFGRGENNSIKVDGPLISRQHCQVTLYADGRIVVEDFKTSNGTRIKRKGYSTEERRNREFHQKELEEERVVNKLKAFVRHLFGKKGRVSYHDFTEYLVGRDPHSYFDRVDYLQGLQRYEQAYEQAYQARDKYQDRRFKIRPDGSFYVPDIESAQGWQELVTSLEDVVVKPGETKYINGIYVVTSDKTEGVNNIGAVRASIDDRQQNIQRKRYYSRSEINPIVKHGMLLKDSLQEYTRAVFGGELLIKVYRRPWYKGGYFAPLELEIIDINDSSGGLLPRTAGRQEKLEAVLKKIQATGIKISAQARENFLKLAKNT